MSAFATRDEERILLTGCNGYIGAWITLELLRAGYRVCGTAQDPEGTRQLFRHVFARQTDGKTLNERLEVTRADLLDAQTWMGLADGCSTVIHTACPVVTDIGAPSRAMVDPALIGTTNVIQEAARAGSVTRYVHMSSIVTLLDHHLPKQTRIDCEIVGPRDWNVTSSPNTDPYAFAKVHGEKKARALVEELLPNASFAAILPGPVIGPPLGKTQIPASIDKTLAPLLSGQLRAGSVDMYLGLVDVRDVATTFVRAAQAKREQIDALGPSARFICVSRPATSLQALADAIREHFPEYGRILPTRRLPMPRWLLLGAMRFTLTREAYSYTRAMLGRRVEYDTTHTEEMLGLTCRPVAESVAETVAWLRSNGLYPVTT